MIDNTALPLLSLSPVKESALPFSELAKNKFGGLCRKIDDLNKAVQEQRTALEEEKKIACPWMDHRWTTGECVSMSIGGTLGSVGIMSLLITAPVSLFYQFIGARALIGELGATALGGGIFCIGSGWGWSSDEFARRFHKLDTIEENLYKAIEQVNALANLKLALEEWEKEPTEIILPLFKLQKQIIKALKNWDKRLVQKDPSCPNNEAPQKFIDEMNEELPHEACKLALMDELSAALPSAKFAQEWQQLMDSFRGDFRGLSADCQPWKDLGMNNPKKKTYGAYFIQEQKANSVLMLRKKIASFVDRQNKAARNLKRSIDSD